MKFINKGDKAMMDSLGELPDEVKIYEGPDDQLIEEMLQILNTEEE